MKTHENFKSFVPGVTDAESIDETVGYALCYQYMFERKTSPWEMARWEDGELQQFRIEVQDVDRLYYINHFDDGVSGSSFAMLVRVVYKGAELFVELNANCDYTGFDCQGGGEIFLTLNANLFSKVLICNEYDMELLYEALARDGYHIEGQNEYDRSPVSAWHKPPMLKFLCHLAIKDNQDRLHHYKQILPKLLVDSVDEFIHIREAISDYDDWC
ncbi:uncharacterized protein [Panulirus ornatus]|uniref:uncharacterized protein n=1 Tax=Panulirus ornatus TaxID=150431 RepID=UPI003A8BBB68